jgi:hypothetical protein
MQCLTSGFYYLIAQFRVLNLKEYAKFAQNFKEYATFAQTKKAEVS